VILLETRSFKEDSRTLRNKAGQIKIHL